MIQRTILILFSFALGIVPQARATVYYVCAATGSPCNASDANAGTSKTATWLHAPGMSTATGLASSTVLVAGDSLIFRGGDTWHFGDNTQVPFAGFQSNAWSFSRSGTSTSCQLNAATGAIVTTTCIYIGVDQTWFAGGSWTRPVFNFDNPVTTTSPASCTFDDTTLNPIHFNASYVIVDNLEIFGFCSNSTTTFSNLIAFSNGNLQWEWKNSYVHGYMLGQTCTSSGGADCDEYWVFGGFTSISSYYRIDHNVFDNSDGTYGGSGNKASLGVWNIGGMQFDHNVLNYVSNGLKFRAMLMVDDNLFNNIFEPVVGGTHGNIIEYAGTGQVYPLSTYYFNNLTLCSSGPSNIGESLDMYPGSSGSGKVGYIFNNISNCNYGGGTGTNCYMIEGDGGNGGPGNTQFFNNTQDFQCMMRSLRGSSTGIYQNNHFVGYSPSGAIGNFSSMTVATDNGNEVWQTTGAACGSVATNYAPTSSSCATVGAGANLTSTLCAGMDNATATAACEHGYGGVTYNTSNHAAVDNAVSARPASGAWDVGAFEFVPVSFILSVTMAGQNAGSTVTSSPAGINCPTICSASFASGTSVTLTENPVGQYFAYGFSSPCPTVTNFGAPCTLVISSATSVTANFNHVTLPQLWTNNMEYLFATSNVVNFPTFWLCNGGTRYPASGNYANTAAGLQQAANDIMQCRHDTNTGTTLIIPSGQLYSSANGLQWTQLAGDNSTQFAVQTSSNPAPLGITLCSHGIQDNILSATKPGLWNPGCNGLNMYYQLGTTINSIPVGAFTLANNTATNTSQYNDLSHLYTIEATGANQNAISTCVTFVGGNCTADWDTNNVGVHHIAILNAELRPVAGQTSAGAPYKVGLATETLVSQIPNHIHLAYSYIHGDWQEAPMSGCPSACVATGIPAGTNSLPYAMFIAGCLFCSEMYNYADGNLRPGAEGHGIGLLLAQENKRAHNWIAGGSIGSICGGWGASMPISNFITCLNDEDRANRYTYPYSWMLAFNGGFNPSGGSFVRKNAHEYKFARFALFDGSICENVDNSGAQNGTACSFKTAQNSGGGAGSNYWTELTHVTASNIIGRTACNGPSFGDRSAAVGNGGGVSMPSQMFIFSNWLFYNLSINLAGCAVSGFSSAPQYSVRNGQSVPSATWSATATRDALGQTTTFTLTAGSGNGATDFSLGDPLTSTGCSDATFNVGNTVMGPPVLSGSTLGTTAPPLTLIVNNPGTANATATGCTVSNAQGYPNYIFLNHATIIADAGSKGPYDSALAGTNIWPLARNISYLNSIFVNGGLSSSAGEGTAECNRGYDPNTFIFNNDFIGGRTAANYSGCPQGNATLYLTPTNNCTGSDPTTGTCLGILSAMSTSTSPLVPGAVGPYIAGDYHAFRLCQATDVACNSKQSLYGAGNTNQATDGTDLGVNFATLDAAQNSTLYVCATPCGLGPSIDTIAIVPAPYTPGFLGYNKPIDIFKGATK